MLLASGTHRGANLIGEWLKSVRASASAGRPSHHLGESWTRISEEKACEGLASSRHSASVLSHTQKRREQMIGLLEEVQQLERARLADATYSRMRSHCISGNSSLALSRAPVALTTAKKH